MINFLLGLIIGLVIGFVVGVIVMYYVAFEALSFEAKKSPEKKAALDVLLEEEKK